MKAEIFSIGTELLMGELTDTNAAWIAGRLPPLGIQLQWVSIIGDNLENLSEAFSRGLQRSDIVITTGGLGPTQDDLTREGVAMALGETPTVQEDALTELQQYFQTRGTSMPSHNIKQAHLIPSSQFIPNPHGTAPGWWTERNGKMIICMPGPPAEMHPMWEVQVEPRLREIVQDEVTLTRNIKTMGMSEGAVDEVVSEFFGKENPYLGIYSKADGIHLRIIARARDISAAQSMVDPIEAAIVERLGPYIWGYDEDTPERALGRSLMARGLTLATMESSTGGYLANTITEVPDSAIYFKGGVVAYSDAAKTAYGVPAETLRQHGAVSQETATAMARTIAHNLGADFGIGITGVAGPLEEEGKPVGLMYVAITGPAGEKELQLRVPPRRITIKRRISNTALIELNRMVNELDQAPD
ncbi:MAG: competence/damage-inducible protein A [Chloroflexi bacterium]|nr:competence/damage-inducible protein A [Chloroflexota bacterium]